MIIEKDKNNYGGELMKITKSQLKRIIKEELNRVQIEKLVNMVLNSPMFTTAQWLLPDSLLSVIREKITEFLYENQDIAQKALEYFLNEEQEKAVEFVMEYVVKPLIDQMDNPRGRTYRILDDDGEALYFEDEFKKEMHHTSPFIKEIARTLKNAGFTYARKLLQRPDGGTDSSDQPVFLYHGNRQYIETMRSIALKHGISLMMP